MIGLDSPADLPINSLDTLVSALFVPATRPERFSKAVSSGADAVIIDLEDAVAISEKARARRILSRSLPQLGSETPLGLRVNAADTEHLDLDAVLVTELAAYLDFLVLPQVHGVHDVQRLQQLFCTTDLSSEGLGGLSTTLPVLALIESSAGLLAASDIAQLPAVRRLALGAADLADEWEVEPSSQGREFDVARQLLVIASRAAGLNGPLDTPHMNVRDAAGLKKSVAAVASLGVKGKLCIHPEQVPVVREGLLVSDSEYIRLRKLMNAFDQAEAAGEAAVKLADGSFVDYPVYRRAARQVADYERGGR